MSNDLEKPLGQNVRGRAHGSGKTGYVAAGCALAIISAAAFWVSMRGTPYSDPLVAKPEPAAIEITQVVPDPVNTATDTPSDIKSDEEALAKTADENVSTIAPGGAKIIRVKPDDTAAQGKVIISNPSDVTQKPAVAHMPEADLVEETAEGRLPKRAEDGRRPMDVYARPWSGGRGAKVAIIVGGMGVSQTATQKAIDMLPPQVTLGFAPQGNSLSRWAQTARRNGHEILLQIPMEPFDYPRIDPGRGTLITDATAQSNLKVLHESMGRLTNYTGVMNYLGARFTSVPAAFEPIMAEIGERGLLYVDDGTSARSLSEKLAVKSRAGFAAADMVLDSVQDKNDILKNLDQLEATARAKGSAIGIATGFDVSIEAVSQWVKDAQQRGIEVVGVAALANDPEN